jgi:hypothetical protein
MLPQEPLRPSNELGFGKGRTARVGGRAGACGTENVRVGPSGGEDGGREPAIIGEARIPQKKVEKVRDRHLPRKKDGPDETGKYVERQRGGFSRTGAVEVDNAEETLDNKEEGVAP